MSTTTSNFKLFKYDTTADAQTAFSITNALNNNWDKLDSNCVRRLSTSAATGSGVRPVYVDASGQVQTINYDLPSTQPLTATTSLSENGYIKFSTGLSIVWGQGTSNGSAMSVLMPIAVLPISVIANTHDTSDACIIAISTSNYEVGMFLLLHSLELTFRQSSTI